GINWIYMRYADIYLMAAEAINELDGPATAAPYLRRIRERAYPGNSAKVDAYMAQVTASPDAFFNAIVQERALEFCGEMLRKADLIRWNKLGEKLNEAKQKLQDLELVDDPTDPSKKVRNGIYVSLPEKVYFKTLSDGETLEIYGLEFGDTDDYGKTNYPAAAQQST